MSTKQDRLVETIHSSVEVVRTAVISLRNIWHANRTDCRFLEGNECTMNGKGVANCTFKGCPYTSYK